MPWLHDMTKMTRMTRMTRCIQGASNGTPELVALLGQVRGLHPVHGHVHQLFSWLPFPQTLCALAEHDFRNRFTHSTIWTQQTKQLGSYCANCACYFVNGLASDQMVANGQIGPIQPFAKALLVPANSPSGLATIFFPAIHFVAAQGPLKLREPWPLLKTAETSRSNVTLWLLPRSNSRSNFLCSLCTLSPGILGEPHVSLQSQKSHPVLVNCKAAAFFAVTSLFVFFTFILTDAVQYRKQWKSLELVQCSSSAHFL